MVVGMNDERGVENVGVGGRECYADAGVRRLFCAPSFLCGHTGTRLRYGASPAPILQVTVLGGRLTMTLCSF